MLRWLRKRKAAGEELQPAKDVSLEEIRDRLRRRAVRMKVGGSKPRESPLASWFGKVLVARPDEPWPITAGGAPMAALCQVNLTELPFRPRRLEDTTFFSVFLDPESFHDCELQDHTKIVVRAYKTLDGLTGIAPPSESGIKAFPMRPEIIEEDFPCHDNLPCDVDLKAFEERFGEYYDHFETAGGFKLGGWPCLVQCELNWEYKDIPSKPEYVFQIDSEEKANWYWGDAGLAYFGRGTAPGTEDQWFFDWQCY